MARSSQIPTESLSQGQRKSGQEGKKRTVFLYCLIRHDPAGQGLVEFAFLLLILVLIAFGVLDLGRAFHAAVTIENAARVGARYGSLHAKDTDTDGIPDAESGIILETRNEAQNSGVPLTSTNSDVEVFCPDGCAPGHPIRIKVTYNFPLVLGFIIPSPFEIVVQAKMVIL